MKEGMKGKLQSGIKGLNRKIEWLDGKPLWWLGLILVAASFLPCLMLGEGSVFTVHDQLDETLLTYIWNARYLGKHVDIFPQMMNGVEKTAAQPSAVLFVLLYRIFPAFPAFLIQAVAVAFCAFLGMYGCIRLITKSSIWAFLTGMLFAMLPMMPVYGLSVAGVPLVFYAFGQLYQQKRKVLSYLLILLFGLTTHLVLIGYVILGLWAVGMAVLLLRKEKAREVFAGGILLLICYLGVNYRLFYELILGKAQYISHRAEQMNESHPVWESIWDLFLNSGQHAVSLHRYFILPILLLIILALVRIRTFRKEQRKQIWLAVGIFGLLCAIAALYGLLRGQAVTDWKNKQNGFLRYFQAERFYWLYPALWYLELGIAAGIWWNRKKSIFTLLLLGILCLPGVNQIKNSGMFYQNVNQWNNGSSVTGYISWESFYAEDLMQQLEEAIGADMETYRIAHLGISPAPALMHGFYTVDGYSNNYSLEYKHRFRKVIEKELEKCEPARIYFDRWGSRCYLFNASSGTYYYLSKRDEAVFEDLEFDMEALKNLGCSYLFSGGRIVDPDALNLEFLGYFGTPESYWGIWLYRLK